MVGKRSFVFDYYRQKLGELFHTNIYQSRAVTRFSVEIP